MTPPVNVTLKKHFKDLSDMNFILVFVLIHSFHILAKYEMKIF